jgi:phage gp29-like protein
MPWYWPFEGKAKKSPGLIQPIQNLHRGYPEDTITPVTYKSILKQADLGYTSDFMELLDACAADYKVASVLRSRKLAVAGAPWSVKPPEGDESEGAKAIADETHEFLDAIPNFTQMKMDLLDAHYRGFAAGRVVYAMVDGSQRVIGWEPIESRFFTFKDAQEPLVITQDNPEGVPLPPEYLFYVVRDRPGPVTRGGTGRSIAKMWLYKGYFAIDMASYIEKFGQPHVQVTIPGNYVEGSAELERAKSAARSLIADHIGLVPEGVVLECLESIKQISTVKETYIAAIQFCDDAIAMAEVGHTLTAGESRTGGLGHGQEAKQAGDVKQEIKEYDARGLEEFLNRTVIWPRHVRQYGENAPRPYLCIDVEEPEDEVEKSTALKLRAETIEILQRAGLDVDEDQVRQEFDLRAPTKALKPVMPEPKPEAGKEGEVKPKKKPAKK